MDNAWTISLKERVGLIVFVGISTAFICLPIASYATAVFNTQVAAHQRALSQLAGVPEPGFILSVCIGMPFAGLHLTVFLVFASLFRARLFKVPFFLAAVHLILFLFSLLFRLEERLSPGEESSRTVSYVPAFSSEMDKLDFILLSFISITLLWLLSIVVRTLRNRTPLR